MNIVFVAVLVFGAIIWSLYIIDPPETEASNEPAVEQTGPLEMMGYDANMVEYGLTSMEEQAALLPPDEAAGYQQQIDEMQAILQNMQESLNAATEAQTAE